MTAVAGHYGLFSSPLPHTTMVRSAHAGEVGGVAHNNVIAVTARMEDNRDVLYLVDTANETILTYAYNRSGSRRLELLAARSFEYDRRLKRFNEGGPSPLEVRDRVLIEEARLQQ
jgi:hypothetical protein